MFDVGGAASAAVQKVWGSLPTADAPAAAPGGAGGSFEMDAEELDAVIGLWEAELDKLVEDAQVIEDISWSFTPPATDDASVGYVNAGVDSIEALRSQNDSMLKYAQEYVKKLKAAKEATVAADEAKAQALQTAE
ncbi:hypothetical protein [Amycolatopsis magusensis]|uniref:PE family protein n=1 Tax=Amycolatopsis magusensis TaxID=882444 RepID=A0ABS4PUQ8_9PSEU|nr:hypothetical protein [Amycolatopsis magusensis]MBP2183172.1 hypothetical protein [Amycolatopsis magusensis]MDI5975324.1 hypothetical protein [Amycolatopsis magusensis]